MQPNPFRLTLAILGVGVMILGAVLWLIGVGAQDPNSSFAASSAILQAAGLVLLGIGWLPFIAWLVVGALQWKPIPIDPEKAASQRKSEKEIAEILRRQRDPGAER